MSWKTKKLLLITGIIILFIFSFLKVNETFKIIELTSIKVEAEQPIEKNKVKVYQSFYSINRENDKELFDFKFANLVFDKNDKGKIKTEYGENDFLVIYDNKYYFQFRQICTNDNDYFKYKLKLFKKGEYIILKKEGDGMKFEKAMNLISDAGKLRCNGPIDDEKGVYNGIELK